jgi:predicted nucleic acid-binding protein
VGRLTVEELCRRHALIGLDTNVLVYLIDQVSPWDGLVEEIITAIEGGLCRATLSALSLGEILGSLARSEELALLERYAAEIRDIPGLTVQPLSADLAVDAAVIGGIRGLSLADAVHLACARAAGATAFVTNDRRIRGSRKLEVVYLDELEPSGA